MNRRIWLEFCYACLVIAFIAFCLGVMYGTHLINTVTVKGDTVKIVYEYNYERLTYQTCVTDFECEVANAISMYHTNHQTDLYSDYEPVPEPTN